MVNNHAYLADEWHLATLVLAFEHDENFALYQTVHSAVAACHELSSLAQIWANA